MIGAMRWSIIIGCVTAALVSSVRMEAQWLN